MLKREVKILNLMLKGHSFNVDDENYSIVDGNLCVERDRLDTSTGEWEVVFMGVDISLTAFLKYFCEKVTDDELTIANANEALTKFNRKDRNV